MESLEPKKAHKSFFLLSWSVMQNTRQQRIHDLNFTLRHHKNYVIKGQFVCLLYADFENYSKHINIVTSFLSIIMQHTVFKYQLKKSHSILWAKRATFTKIAKNSQNSQISKISKIAKISKVAQTVKIAFFYLHFWGWNREVFG